MHHEESAENSVTSSVPSRRLRWVSVGIAALVGFCISILTFDVERREANSQFGETNGVFHAWMDANRLQKAAELFRQSKGEFPTTLADLDEITKHDIRPDPWGRPYHLVRDGQKLRVVSYGRDGVPGGAGVDADVTGDDAYDPAPLPLEQFLALTSRTQSDIVIPCVACGLIGAAITYIAGGSRQRAPLRLARVAVANVITVIMALATGWLIVFAHIPSGH